MVQINECLSLKFYQEQNTVLSREQEISSYRDLRTVIIYKLEKFSKYTFANLCNFNVCCEYNL